MSVALMDIFYYFISRRDPFYEEPLHKAFYYPSRNINIKTEVNLRSSSLDISNNNVPCHKLPIAQSIVSSPTNQPVCRCLIIKLFTQVVTVVTNQN